MKRRLFFCVVLWLSCVAVARAAGDFVVLGSGNSFWTNHAAAPVCTELARLQKDGPPSHVAFTPSGDWLVLIGGNGFYTSNLDLPACKKLAELQQRQNTFKCVAFTPRGG